MDRAFGATGARIAYARDAEGAWTVRIDDPGPLARLGPLAGGIAGLEITALTRGEDGPWRLEGRPAAPETVAASGLAARGAIDGTAPASAGTNQPEKEVDDGTQAPDGS